LRHCQVIPGDPERREGSRLNLKSIPKPAVEAGFDPRPSRDCRSLAPVPVPAALVVRFVASEAGGKKMYCTELREPIFHMIVENSPWGAPCIQGELKMLGFEISEKTDLGCQVKGYAAPP
jgi:hypothetical protein